MSKHYRLTDLELTTLEEFYKDERSNYFILCLIDELRDLRKGKDRLLKQLIALEDFPDAAERQRARDLIAETSPQVHWLAAAMSQSIYTNVTFENCTFVNTPPKDAPPEPQPWTYEQLERLVTWAETSVACKMKVSIDFYFRSAHLAPEELLELVKLARTAFGANTPKQTQASIPILHGDGEKDDTAALQAHINGEPFLVESKLHLDTVAAKDAEIKRLTEQNEKHWRERPSAWENSLATMNKELNKEIVTTHQTIVAKDAEIKKLCDQWPSGDERAAQAEAKLAVKEAEIVALNCACKAFLERIDAKNAELKQLAEAWNKLEGRWEGSELAKAQAEVARLRKALKKAKTVLGKEHGIDSRALLSIGDAYSIINIALSQQQE